MKRYALVCFLFVACADEVLDEVADGGELGNDAGDLSSENYSPLPNLIGDAGEALDEVPDGGELGNDAGVDVDDLVVSLDVEKTDRGGYSGDGPYVSVDYEHAEESDGFMTASRIALLARLAVEVWRDLDYPEVDAVAEKLSRFHVFALSSDDTYARFRRPELYAENPDAAIEAMTESGAFCKPAGDSRYVDVPETARFFIVINASFLEHSWSAATVLHEIVHAILLAAYGDADPDHERPGIWLPRSGVDNGSFMALVIERSPF